MNEETIKALVDDFRAELAAIIAADEKPLTLEAARRTLDDAIRLRASRVSFADWCATVRPDIEAYAIKQFGSLQACYEDSVVWMNKTVSMCADQVVELERAAEAEGGK